jgi:hypothetical protein
MRVDMMTVAVTLAEVFQRLLALYGLAEPQVDTVMQLVSLVEYGHPRWRRGYGSAEFLGDGQGLTATLFGASSASGDLARVVEELAKIRPEHPLVRRGLPVLRGCAAATDDGERARLQPVADLVGQAGDDPCWQVAVWRVFIDLYWQFAADFAEKKGACRDRPGPVLALAVSRGFVLDTALNHGPDLAAFQKMFEKMRAPRSRDELAWLLDFMQAREDLLRSGFQHLDTTGTGDRCKLWRSIVESENYALARPMRACTGYWGSYTL